MNKSNDSNDSTHVLNHNKNKEIIYGPNNSKSKKLTPAENSPNFEYTSNNKISNDLLPNPSDNFNNINNNKNYLNNSLNNRKIEDSPTFKKMFYTTNSTRKQKQKRKRKQINQPNRISQIKIKKNESSKKKPFK